MWDLAEDPTSIKLIEGFWAAGKAVCWLAGVLVPDGDVLTNGSRAS
jgi:hypothetical protein